MELTDPQVLLFASTSSVKVPRRGRRNGTAAATLGVARQ